MDLLQQKMLLKGIFRDLLLSLLMAAAYCSAPVQCMSCNVTAGTTAVSNNTTMGPNKIPPNCSKDFQVCVNSTASEAEEGDTVTLTCVHNLTEFSEEFVWKKDGEDISRGQNKSQLVLDKVFSHDSGQYTCTVIGICGIFESPPHGVTVHNRGIVPLIVCGVSALVLVLAVSLVLKWKVSRQNARQRERMKQRAQNDHAAAPVPFTPRQS